MHKAATCRGKKHILKILKFYTDNTRLHNFNLGHSDSTIRCYTTTHDYILFNKMITHSKYFTFAEREHQRLHTCIIKDIDLLRMGRWSPKHVEVFNFTGVSLQQVHKTATCREREHQRLHTCIIKDIDLLRMGRWSPKHVEVFNFTEFI
jgi:hypothetical protein